MRLVKFSQRVKAWLARPEGKILLLLVILGAVWRFNALGTRSLWLDTAQSAIYARAFLEKGWPVIGGSEFTRSLLHSGLVALSFAGFGVSEAAGRIPTVIFGVLTIPLAFLIGRRMKDEKIGVVFAFLLTFSTFLIAWSRQLRFYGQLQFFFLLSLYFVEKAIDDVSWRNFLLLAISSTSMVLSDIQFGSLLLLPIVISFLGGISKRMKEKLSNLRGVRLRDWFGLAVLVLIVGGGIYLMRGKIMEQVSQLIYNPPIAAKIHPLNYLEFFWTNPGHLFLLAIPGAELAVFHRKRNMMYVLSFLLPFLIIAFRVYYAVRHITMIYPLIFAFTSFTLVSVYEKVRNYLSKKGWSFESRTYLPAILIIAIVASPAGATSFVPQEKYDLGPTVPYANFRGATEFIAKNWEDNHVLATTIFPTTYFYLPDEKYTPYYRVPGLWGFPMKHEYLGSVEEIKKLREKKDGWIITDGISIYRMLNGGRKERKIAEYLLGNVGWVKGVGGKGVRVIPL